MEGLYMYIQMDENAGPPAAAITESNRACQPNSVINNNGYHLNAKGAGRIKEKSRHVPVEQWRRIGPVFLAVVIIVVWGLLSVPIIFYHLPQDQMSNSNETVASSVSNSSIMNSNESTSGSGNQSNAVCLTIYAGTKCLQPLQNCLPGEHNTSEIFISNRIDDQSLLEDDIDSILYFLDLLIRPSDECRRRVVPFLCLYTFGICDEYGVDYRPEAAECSDIRDNVCESEWQEANSALVSFGMPTLPDCSTFSDDGLVCSSENLTELCTIQCHYQFYCENNFCKPHCHRFRDYSDAYTVTADVLVVISASIGILSGGAVLLISCLRRKRMLSFPTVFVFYLTIILMVFDLFALLTFTDQESLYCTSINLVQAIENPSAFCRITGGVFYYSLAQASLWWLFHVSALFWKVMFPIHSKVFETARRTKYIHVVMVALALLLPLIPAITGEVIGGYTITRFPPILCTGSDADATFYSLVFPIIIIIGIGTSLLVIMFWKIHMQQRWFRSRMLKNPITLGTAERKILLVFLYYITLGVFVLTSFTLATKNLNQNTQSVIEYFDCEKNGRNNACSITTQQNPVVILIAQVLLGLFPVINLVFAVNVQEIKACVKQLNRKLRKESRKAQMSTTEDKSESTADSNAPKK